MWGRAELFRSMSGKPRWSLQLSWDLMNWEHLVQPVDWNQIWKIKDTNRYFFMDQQRDGLVQNPIKFQGHIILPLCYPLILGKVIVLTLRKYHQGALTYEKLVFGTCNLLANSPATLCLTYLPWAERALGVQLFWVPDAQEFYFIPGIQPEQSHCVWEGVETWVNMT